MAVSSTENFPSELIARGRQTSCQYNSLLLDIDFKPVSYVAPNQQIHSERQCAFFQCVIQVEHLLFLFRIGKKNQVEV